MGEQLREINTVEPPATVWCKVQEDDFRRNLVALEDKTNAVPVDVLTVSVQDEADESYPDVLALATEKQVADDLAYIAAGTEGAQSVAAVCLEQHVSNRGTSTLLVRVAGMDVVDKNVKLMLAETSRVLQHVSSSTQKGDVQLDNDSTEALLHLIIQQHQQKLLGRLRSKKWVKPVYLARTHKKSLWRDFENVIHRAQHIYPKKLERRTRDSIKSCLDQLCQSYEGFEDTGEDTQIALRRLVKGTYHACQLPVIAAYAKKLEEVHATPQVAAALKTFRQLEKIGAYWRIAISLNSVAQKHPASFQYIRLEYITPYHSVPTSIAYEPWAKTCHVHAEIQLAIHYALQPDDKRQAGTTILRPRTIGTSKYLCYLCFLFLQYHGRFKILNTHGRLYDQWTVPDLEEYDNTVRESLSNVLQRINQHIVNQLEDTKALVWRPEPMTSRQNLLYYYQTSEEDLN